MGLSALSQIILKKTLKKIQFQWTPRHRGIGGYEEQDESAEKATNNLQPVGNISYDTIKQVIQANGKSVN